MKIYYIRYTYQGNIEQYCPSGKEGAIKHTGFTEIDPQLH